MITVCSFYVDRRADYPNAVDYIPLLCALEDSCRRVGYQHVVLSDRLTMEQPDIQPLLRRSCLGFGEGGLTIGPRGGPLTFTTSDHMDLWSTDLPRSLSRATTEAQARHLEAWAKFPLFQSDFLFVGADCLITDDFRNRLPEADLSIILRPGHKKHRINNGFMYVPAASVGKVAKLFRRIANNCGEVMCDDMVAVEVALAPMPMDYGIVERSGLTVNFLPMDIWNGGPKTVDDTAGDSFVLHFRGRQRKRIMVEWAQRNLFNEKSVD